MPRQGENLDTQEQAVRDAEQGWNAAILRRDVAAAREFMAPEYQLLVGIEGRNLARYPLALWLAALPNYVIHSHTTHDMNISVWGDVAVATLAHWQDAEAWDGRDISGNFMLTDVWVFRDGRWLVAERHSSRLEEMPSSKA
ncbi:MAG TPA: nuclear transport factor 2 family protein [Terracidiphilus sp.]